MQVIRFALRNLWRDLRSGELSVLLLALMIAVLSLTAVGFFISRVSAGVSAQAAEVLAADLRLESSVPIPPQYFSDAESRGLKTAKILSFPTAIFNGGQNQLVAFNAVSQGYPLRGHVRIADVPFGVARETNQIPGKGEVWLDARVMAQLQVALGTSIHIGAATFKISQVLDYRPDQGGGFANLAPAALINYADLDATQLIQPGSRANYYALFAGPADAVADFRTYLKKAKTPSERIDDVANSSRQLSSAIDRATRFLNLASLAAVLLAAIAVAMGARRYAARHIDTVALMKCMGASQNFVLMVSLVELTLLALFAVLIGSAFGFVAQLGLAWLLKSLIHGVLPGASLAPLPIALVTVVAMLIGFAAPPLLQLKNTPPARVLRKSVSAPPLRYGVSYLLALGALIAILWSLVHDTELVLGVLAGVVGVGVALALAGFGLVRLTGRLRGGVGVAWRYGLANVSRRGGGSVVQIVAFGLGLMVLLLLAVVRGDLLADWRRSLPANVPNNFLINIRPDERQALQDFLDAHQFGKPALYPMVRARITAINAQSTAEFKPTDDAARDEAGGTSSRGRSGRGEPARGEPARGESARGYIDREQNLTWSANLMEDNQLIAGRWWTAADAGKPLVSVSSEYAEALKLKIGDKLSFDVAGEPLTVEVASIRKIRWDSFRPNFFLVFPPGLLDGAAGTYMTAIYLTPAQRPALGDLVRQFPTVSVFDVDAILKQIRDIMDRASLAVQYVFLFTLVAGIIVLLAAVQSTRDERRYESAMLRTLGASRMTVLQGVAAEFSALGFLSGTLAAMGATGIGVVLARRLFSLEYTLDPWVWVAGLVCGTVLVGLSGTLATRSVINTPPIVTLRDE
jgi:putative ABC transport system permease protein